jgi:hypothetical protein
MKSSRRPNPKTVGDTVYYFIWSEASRSSRESKESGVSKWILDTSCADNCWTSKIENNMRAYAPIKKNVRQMPEKEVIRAFISVCDIFAPQQVYLYFSTVYLYFSTTSLIFPVFLFFTMTFFVP